MSTGVRCVGRATKDELNTVGAGVTQTRWLAGWQVGRLAATKGTKPGGAESAPSHPAKWPDQPLIFAYWVSVKAQAVSQVHT